MKSVIIAAYLAINAVIATAWGESPYVGQEHRTIKSLSPQDIAELESGAGWGLAKPAELNGIPGPKHVLELAKELVLSPSQFEQIEALFVAMQSSAKTIGADYLSVEMQIEQLLRTGQPDLPKLSELLTLSGQHLAKLRNVHLRAHWATLPILSEHQSKQYQRLRGYETGSGHNPGHKH